MLGDRMAAVAVTSASHRVWLMAQSRSPQSPLKQGKSQASGRMRGARSECLCRHLSSLVLSEGSDESPSLASHAGRPGAGEQTLATLSSCSRQKLPKELVRC